MQWILSRMKKKVSKSFLENEDVDVIVNVVDASNLSRNLYLTTQLMQFNKPIVILLNMTDIAENKGIKIDPDKLAKELNVTIIPIVAKRKNGIDKIESAITNSVNKSFKSDINFGNEVETYKKLEDIYLDVKKPLLNKKNQ